MAGAPSPQQGDIVIVRADIVTKSERRITLWASIITAAATVVTTSIFVLAYNKGRI